MDTAALAAGHQPLAPEVREARMPDGAVLTIVRTLPDGSNPDALPRQIA